MRHLRGPLTPALILASLCSSDAVAKDKHRRPDNVDQIVIDAHLTVAGGPITRFIATRHYNRLYVYAEREAGQNITLLDVTQPAKPRVLSEVVAFPAQSGAVNLLTVAGTAALSSDVKTEAKPAAPQTLRLMDFSDPANPKVSKQFDGVTAVENIGGGVILLANADGIWILSQKFAEDPEEDRRYAEKVIYGEK